MTTDPMVRLVLNALAEYLAEALESSTYVSYAGAMLGDDRDAPEIAVTTVRGTRVVLVVTEAPE